MDRYEFALSWRSLRGFWKCYCYLQWVIPTLWCAIRLKPGPGERLLLQMMSEDYNTDSELVRRKWAAAYLEEGE